MKEEVYKMSKRLLAKLLLLVLLIGGFTSTTAKADELSVNGGYITYRVVSGDSLWRISHKFHTTVAYIKSLNTLRSDAIYVGQSLKVPSHSNVSKLLYTVQPGDNLWAVAHRLGVTVNGIKAASGITSDTIYVGQMLTIAFRNPVTTVNYRVASGESVWGLSTKYKTSTDAIIKSNYMQVDYFKPGQIVTVPLNSTRYVRPVDITMLRRKASMWHGDIYTWDNGRRLFTVGTKAVAMDVATGAKWNIRYYGGSNHADIEPLTQTDTNTMYRVFGYKWSWTNKRPVVIIFNQGGIKYQIATSLFGMPHGDDATHIAGNGMKGHCCLYLYYAKGHSNPVIDPASQQNVLRANGQ
jgi:LysM repeat protein